MRREKKKNNTKCQLSSNVKRILGVKNNVFELQRVIFYRDVDFIVFPIDYYHNFLLQTRKKKKEKKKTLLIYGSEFKELQSRKYFPIREKKIKRNNLCFLIIYISL